MTDCGCHIEAKNAAEQKTLYVLLALNGLMFVVELACGLYAQSSGLIADAMDMLADAMVYAIALYAVTRSTAAKISAARLSGILQILLGLSVAIDVIRRVVYGSEPDSFLMMAIGGLALIVNFICVSLIAKHRDGGIHMRASWIFSKNDLLANLGVIISGGLVMAFATPWPDLIIGALIAGLVTWGGISILRDVKREASCASN